jgi:hypothetical protein
LVAEGAVDALGAWVQATPAISKARQELTRNNFIQRLSKMRPAELL